MVSLFVHEHSAGINERMLCTKDAVNILNHFANNCVQLQHWIYIIQIIVLSFFFSQELSAVPHHLKVLGGCTLQNPSVTFIRDTEISR